MQRLVEIGDQVVGIFKPNRQPNQSSPIPATSRDAASICCVWSMPGG